LQVTSRLSYMDRIRLRKIEGVLGSIATVVTLLVFLTGLDIPKLFNEIQAQIDRVLKSKPQQVNPPTAVALVFWGIATFITSLIATGRQPLREFVLEFAKNFWLIGSILFTVGLIWSFRIGEDFRILLIFVFIDVILVASLIRAIAGMVNKTGRWPEDFGTNAFIIGALVGTQLIAVNVQLGMSIILVSLILVRLGNKKGRYVRKHSSDSS